VFAALTAKDGTLAVFSAQRAELVSGGSDYSVTIRLHDGDIVHVNPARGDGRRASFATYDVPLSMPAVPAFRARGIHERELTLPELLRAIERPAGAVTKAQAEAGLYRRAAQVAVLFFLPLLAVSQARPPARSASGFGLVLGVGIVIVYNEFSLFGERLGFTARVEPLPAQAASFVPFAGLCIVLFLVFSLLPGAAPLGRAATALTGLKRGRPVSV